MTLKTIKESEMGSVKIKDVFKKYALNFTDIGSNSNKFYLLELQESDNNEFYIYTSYGRTGGTQNKEYRICSSRDQAETEAEKIIKSKKKKGYVEVKLVKTDIGSELGKSQIETSKVSIDDLNKVGIQVTNDDSASKLHPEVKDLVKTWFGITAEFVELNLDTKKSPLGQLSLDQVIKGKDILEECRKLVQVKRKDIKELTNLSNQYYSNIPFNFGYKKINADELRLDNDSKIDQAFDVLDVLGTAKDVQGVISKKNAVDEQYNTLNADLDYIAPSDPVWKWIDAMFHGTRASNHHFLGKLKIHKIFKLARKKEDKYFLETAEEIAKESCKFNPSEVYAKYVKSRPDVPKELESLYKKANILPGWHGTRSANMIGITTKGLLIRPSGVTYNGAIFGPGNHFASNSTKAVNYSDCKGSYWAQGGSKTAYLFLADVAFGKQKIVHHGHYYTRDNIRPDHSIWAKAGGSLYNDEFITYVNSGKGQQHILRYIIEFESQAK